MYFQNAFKYQFGYNGHYSYDEEVKEIGHLEDSEGELYVKYHICILQL